MKYFLMDDIATRKVQHDNPVVRDTSKNSYIERIFYNGSTRLCKGGSQCRRFMPTLLQTIEETLP